MADPVVKLHKGDLPSGLKLGASIAIDSETLGLNPHRDRLCLLQLSAGDGSAHLVQFEAGEYAAPNLRALLTDTDTLKIFHFARFDVAVIAKYFGIIVTPIFCTKIASKLVRTYTDRHGLKDLAAEILNMEISKQQQSSDWAAAELTQLQLAYAASDVLHLHAIKSKLDVMLDRENRRQMAEAAFRFLPVRAELDLAGFGDVDIFAH
ncbi:MAG: ribonuclease D [Hyphomicrobium sp.]|nr:MAG: ribonuclease D [Hyphomicrobium sp.]